MTLLAVLLILFVLAGYGLKEYYQIKIGPPTTTPVTVRDEIVAILNDISPAGRMLDLGSGWGTFVLDLAKRLPDWQVDGLEAAPTPWFIANCRSIGSKLPNFRFFIGRMEQQALQNYDLLYINQPTKNMQPMLQRLVRCLQSDMFIIAYPNPLPRLPNPDIFLTARNEKFYLYRGIDAVVFLNPPPPPVSADPAPLPEPADEPSDGPGRDVKPTADNGFEDPSLASPSAETAAPTDVPPVNDYPEQSRLDMQPSSPEAEPVDLPRNQTD